MSNDRIISVKSSVLEKSLRDAGLCRFEADAHAVELRALLDAPGEQPPEKALCDFYEVTDYPGLVRELVGHVAQLQESAKRNVKPWEDTFPPTLLPAHIERVNAANAAMQPQGELVAEIVEFGFGLKEISWKGGKMPEVGVKLYSGPPAKPLPSIMDLDFATAHSVECELPGIRLNNGDVVPALLFPAPPHLAGSVAGAGHSKVLEPVPPILVEAVAVVRECDEEGLRLEWLLEGGIAALELPGTILLVAQGTLTNDSGNGYVYPARNPADDE